VRQIAVSLGCSFTNVRYWLKKHDLQTRRGVLGRLPKDLRVEAHRKRPRSCPCGERDPKRFYGHKTSICGACHNRVCLRSNRLKRNKALAFLGGACHNCGFKRYKSALDIHHRDPAVKDPSFQHYRGWSWARIERELRKCVLLCRNCHAAVHSGELSIGG
jgi:hypothetical protein